MARPLEFDRETALDAGMRLFWRHGYSATSMSQLLEEMGISRSSFYASFGDKQALYLECLDRFAERTVGFIRDDTPPSTIVIRQFFERTLLKVPRRRAARGCMMVNTLLELADVEPALSKRAAAHLAKVEAHFADCFHASQLAGDYPADRDPKELAACLMVINQGLRVASRSVPSKAALQQLLEVSLRPMALAS